MPNLFFHSDSLVEISSLVSNEPAISRIPTLYSWQFFTPYVLNEFQMYGYKDKDSLQGDESV